MFEVKAESMFSAAHHLLNYEGKCENQHGHNWKVEITARGNSLNKANIMVDFKFLKSELNKTLELLDHKDLNELEYFRGESPSSEMIAKFIYENVKKTISCIYSVAVWETTTSCAKYYEE